jgi:hypothetical protein
MERHIGGVQVIANAEGAARVLFDPGDVSEFSEELIQMAYVEFPLPSVAVPEDIEIQIYTLDTRWQGGGLAWATPWRTPGGDLDDQFSFTETLSAGQRAGRIRFDVTHAVRAMAEGAVAQNGFLLTVPPSLGEGFTGSARAVMQNLQPGKLVVLYRKLTAHGLRGGPDELLKRREQRAFDEDRPRPARDTRAEP